LVLLVAVGRSLDRPLRLFLAAAVPLVAWLVLEVAAFASVLSPRVEERNLFYVAPLFLIALLAWIDRGMPRPARAAAAAAVVAAVRPRPAARRLRLVRVHDRTGGAFSQRVPEGVSRRALPGHHGEQARLGRRGRWPQGRRCVRLLGRAPDRTAAHPLGERILQ